MTAAYVLTETAEEELDAILAFVAERDGADRAVRVYEAFVKAFNSIADAPNAGFLRPHLTGSFRWRPVFRFLVIYDPDSLPPTILRVVHGARDLEFLLSSDS